MGLSAAVQAIALRTNLMHKPARTVLSIFQAIKSDYQTYLQSCRTGAHLVQNYTNPWLPSSHHCSHLKGEFDDIR